MAFEAEAITYYGHTGRKGVFKQKLVTHKERERETLEHETWFKFYS